LIIEDLFKASKWFKKPGNGPTLLDRRVSALVYSDPAVWGSGYHEMTVQKLLSVIGSAETNGIALYKSTNADKTEFTKLNP